jgi:membrane protease YdiL (CAAX protease family)
MINFITGTIFVVMFSYFIHEVFPLRVIAFFSLTALALLIAADQQDNKFLGWVKDARELRITIFLSIIVSISTVLYLRNDAGLSLIPVKLKWFAIIAVAIGCTEELVFRGWLQSQFNGKWGITGIIFAALAHASYKTALFLSPAILYDVSTSYLFVVTFIAGIFLGATRHFTGSLWPAIIAHAIFDLLVYGDSALPWWVF